MRAELWALIGVFGVCIWAMRVVPLRFGLSHVPQGGALARFMAATGVAAIATLFAASIMPEVAAGRAGPAALGSLAVLAAYFASRSVVLASVAGAVAYGAAFAFLA